MEDYVFDIKENANDNKVFVLIIYDIVDNKRRKQLSDYLLGYGFRIQKSAFEAVIKINKYERMMAGISKFVDDEEDSVRVYRITGKGQVNVFGKDVSYSTEETIII